MYTLVRSISWYPVPLLLAGGFLLLNTVPDTEEPLLQSIEIQSVSDSGQPGIQAILTPVAKDVSYRIATRGIIVHAKNDGRTTMRIRILAAHGSTQERIVPWPSSDTLLAWKDFGLVSQQHMDLLQELKAIEFYPGNVLGTKAGAPVIDKLSVVGRSRKVEFLGSLACSLAVGWSLFLLWIRWRMRALPADGDR